MKFNLFSFFYLGVEKYPPYAGTIMFCGLIVNLVSSPVVMHNLYNLRDIIHNDTCK